ncbi:MAG: DUF5050 domain-containing protein [Actinobacteria bacterium]|nr:DUF5050 domain-containing protein [Actinomycetota bacterium]
MKKKWLFFPILAIILIFAFLPISFLKANPGNMVQNGDFAGGNLNSWNSWGDVAVMNGAAVIYSNIGTNSGIRQLINTTEKNLIFSFDVSPRYGANSGVQIAFNIYKNGVAQGQAFGYFNNLPPVQWSHISFKVSDFWQQNTGAPYSDFDQIEIIAEAYNGCIAQFDNFSLEGAAPQGTSLEVTKDATAEGEGYLTWTIKKSVDKASFDLAVGKTATAKYTVTVAPAYHETGITVSGNINIKNDGTSGEAASITYVKDRIEYKIGAGPWTELTTEDISGPFTIAAGDTSVVPYSVSFAPVAGATAYQNTALVGLANCAISGGGVGFQEFAYTTGFSISGGTITSDAFADVSDSLQGYLGQSWVGDTATYKYTYTRKIGPYLSPGNYKVGNTATVTGKDTHTAVSASASIKVHVTGKGTITVYKDLKAPDGKSEPLIPDNHKFNITLQKLTSSVWKDVETKTISGGGSQVFNVEIGFEYRVVEAEDNDYVQIVKDGSVSLEKNEQNKDIRLKAKQKFAIIKVTKDVIGPNGGNISDNHWFLVRLKGGSRTFYQPVREGFCTYFVVWPGKYTSAEFPETDYKLENIGSPIAAYSNGIYKIDLEAFKNSLLDYGSKIVFTSYSNGNNEIYIMNVDGSGQTRLTNNPAADDYPSFSPDGSKIIFASTRDGNWEIYIMNADGSGQTRLTNNSVFDEYPCFSPDGTKIAFTSYRDASYEIYIMNADGSGQTNLTNNPAFDGCPSFSPDGSKIAFASFRDGNYEIYIMNADGSGQTNLTNNPASDYDPSFSP